MFTESLRRTVAELGLNHVEVDLALSEVDLYERVTEQLRLPAS